MIPWQYIAIGVFALTCGGVIGWYVALKRRLGPGEDQRGLFTRAVSALLLLLAVGSVGQTLYFQHEQAAQANELSATTECQYRVNKALIEVLNRRQNPSQDKDEALVTMVRTVLEAKSATETRAALRTFINAVDTLNKTRTDNPYPTIPNDCRPSS